MFKLWLYCPLNRTFGCKVSAYESFISLIVIRVIVRSQIKCFGLFSCFQIDLLHLGIQNNFLFGVAEICKSFYWSVTGGHVHLSYRQVELDYSPSWGPLSLANQMFRSSTVRLSIEYRGGMDRGMMALERETLII